MGGFIKCGKNYSWTYDGSFSSWERDVNKVIEETAPLREYDVIPKYAKACKNKISNEDYFMERKLFYIPQIDTSKRTNFKECFRECYNLITVPYLDTSKGTSFEYMFDGCELLYKFSQSELNTSQGTNFKGMFWGCKKLIEVPQLDTSQGTDFSNMFFRCDKLTTIPQIDTSQGTNFRGMFYISGLIFIPELNLSNCINCQTIFFTCRRLEEIEKIICNSLKTSYMKSAFKDAEKLSSVTIEGTIKVNSSDLNLSGSPLLTVDSIMSFINAFEDNTGEETQYTVTFGATNLAKLTEEQIAIATNKNILLA